MLNILHRALTLHRLIQPSPLLSVAYTHVFSATSNYIYMDTILLHVRRLNALLGPLKRKIGSQFMEFDHEKLPGGRLKNLIRTTSILRKKA